MDNLMVMASNKLTKLFTRASLNKDSDKARAGSYTGLATFMWASGKMTSTMEMGSLGIQASLRITKKGPGNSALKLVSPFLKKQDWQSSVNNQK
jgi:hypothetical protein